ncbi:MAG: T9SS type A sorting domain-containing protein, partial [Flavobacteriales bacterium]|nr:T9SS type A sorting domain-containing protein [Flavobacteriales bacterium]
FFSVASAQVTLPIDFESGTGTSDFTDFDGGTAEVVANPAPDAVNESATVCKLVRNGGLPWGGSLLQLGEYFDFAEASSIRMKVWSPRQGVRVKLKLEGYLDTEIDQWNVTQGGWEVMTWNFAGEYAMTYDKLVFMFDFENVGDGSDQSTFYFDDIEQVDASGGLNQIDLPCTFEDETVDQTTYDFWGNASQIVEDPTMPGNHVVEVVKMPVAVGWSGTMIGTIEGFANNIPFTEEEKTVSIRVWTPAAGTPILLKTELTGEGIYAETIQYTSQEGWETLEFNFGNELPGGPELEVNYPYDLLVIFFGFGDEGVEGGTTYYFDDVYFGQAPATNVTEAQASNITMFPNPVGQNDLLRVAGVDAGTTATVVDAMGRVVWQGALAANGNRLGLRTGTYTVRIQTAQGMTRQQLLVR